MDHLNKLSNFFKTTLELFQVFVLIIFSKTFHKYVRAENPSNKIA